jgi:hypothetical protein
MLQIVPMAPTLRMRPAAESRAPCTTEARAAATAGGLPAWEAGYALSASFHLIIEPVLSSERS